MQANQDLSDYDDEASDDIYGTEFIDQAINIHFPPRDNNDQADYDDDTARYLLDQFGPDLHNHSRVINDHDHSGFDHHNGAYHYHHGGATIYIDYYRSPADYTTPGQLDLSPAEDSYYGAPSDGR